ncbi:MAG: endo-1,3-alpha-glucanase family glycosylhydrolase [Planctomycetota bacterium]|nr:endo-1,3-alpha-glucanase family glycosylhydrolase [Planctomycetota bacterium]
MSPRLARLSLPLALLAWLLAGSLAAAPTFAQAAPAPAPAADKPADPPKAPAPLSATPAEDARHWVFAHYMTCFFSSVEFYKYEIELAQRHGIDGFALNCGGWASFDPKAGKFVPEGYTSAAERMYQAAKELNTNFKIMISPDMNGLGGMNKIEDMVQRFYTHPNQFRRGNKVVISAWAGLPDTYAGVMNKLKADGYEVCFVPFVFNARYAMAYSPETVQRMFQNQPHMGGWFNFAADGSLGDVMRSNADARRVTMALDKVFMAGITPAYNSANMRDWRGMLGYGAAWRGVIRDNADWVELVTWNDYQEDSNLMPFHWPANSEKRYFNRDESYLDVTGYYTTWYKTGAPPVITQDKVYATYRNRSKYTRQAWDEQAKAWVDLANTAWPYDQMHDDVGDNIYVDTFLTAPAKLKIELAGKSTTFDQPAGVGHARIPITGGAGGVPRFTLTRDKQDKPIVDFSGRKMIITEPTKEDSIRGSAHYANRTWTSAGVAGPVQHLAAPTGTLANGATVVKQGDLEGVSILGQPGCGFTLPVKEIKTGTYNIRITYSNPAPTEARLTLAADGASRGKGEYPHFIPAFLPPTGTSKSATVSFLWSLYDAITFLKLSWETDAGNGKPSPELNDQGTAVIHAIDLVRVDAPTPAKPPALAPSGDALPTMAKIPGGDFTMGGPGGEPDELPAHKVTLAPFEMAETLVTNREFERFDPAHKQFRDAYSWRNDEPVIYVSWVNAAHYCNWLSKQAGLTPVYEEVPIENTKQTRLEANLKNNGYRLPTEAEFEYVASGRGEKRKYPWGADAPDARHGNIGGPAAGEGPSKLRATEAVGVSVVGDFPANASRDGVLDLSGNLCQWCSDWFQPYAAEAQTNPLNTTKGEHRVVRGGSWGYYGLSQRSNDREFQNPNYPGYVYIGIRIVKPTGK